MNFSSERFSAIQPTMGSWRPRGRSALHASGASHLHFEQLPVGTLVEGFVEPIGGFAAWRGGIRGGGGEREVLRGGLWQGGEEAI